MSDELLLYEDPETFQDDLEEADYGEVRLALLQMEKKRCIDALLTLDTGPFATVFFDWVKTTRLSILNSLGDRNVTTDIDSLRFNQGRLSVLDELLDFRGVLEAHINSVMHAKGERNNG